MFDTGVSTGDYPRGYTVTTSTDGVNWTTAAVAGGPGESGAWPVAQANPAPWPAREPDSSPPSA